MFIRFKNSSTWQLIGSDRYDATVGAGPAGIVYSEWALANPSAWAYHRPMLVENGGWAIFITTPRGRNHAKAMYDAHKGDPKWHAEVSTIADTKALGQEDLDEALADYVSLYGEDAGLAYFRQEYHCDFNAAILGAFYAREMATVRAEGRIIAVEAADGPVHTAWDIGRRDDTSIWWWQVQGTQPVLLDCHTENHGNVELFAELDFKKRAEHGWQRTRDKRGEQLSIDWVPHDAKVAEWGTTDGRTRLESMRLFGLNPRLCPSIGKQDGINAVRRTLPRCVFHPRCEEKGISALELYRREWDDEKKMFRESEVRDWTTHLADAFRYFALAWREVPVVIVKPKPKAGPGQVYLAGPPEPRKSTRIRV